VEDIESEIAARRKRTGAKPLGVAAVLAQHPFRRPKKTKKSPAPAFHAASKTVRWELWDAYALFVAAYRTAAEKLRAGVRRRRGWHLSGAHPNLRPLRDLLSW